jgi:transposase
VASLEEFETKQLVYVDESGIDCYLHRSHGWAHIGSKVIGESSGRRFARESFIAAKCGGKIIAPMCFTGTCDTDLYNLWLETFLIPELIPGQVVIMDNAAFHKSQKTKELIDGAKCRLIFLPPYSPDLNPIEKFWANLKAKIKSLLQEDRSLSNAIDLAFAAYDS